MNPSTDRATASRDAVLAELDVLRAHVRGEDAVPCEAAARSAREHLGGPSTLDDLAQGFGLTAFERAVLLLAAGPELVAAVGEDLATLGGGRRLTFGTALAVLPDAHWSALTPPAPLRRWELVTLAEPSSPTGSPLVVDERVLHHLAGAGYLDSRLAALARPLPPPVWLPPELGAAAERLAAAWRTSRAVVLHGPQRGNVRAVVGAAADRLGMNAMLLSATDVPREPEERDRLLRRLERDTVLSGVAWVVDLADAPQDDARGLVSALQGLDTPLALVADDGEAERPGEAVVVHVGRLQVGARREAVGSALRRAGVDPRLHDVDQVAGVFDLALDDLESVASEVRSGASLWTACRERSQAALAGLASVLPARATWDDLVLPPTQTEQLRALVASVRHRVRVLDDWGFADRSTRGLGTTALFTGPSGTGKTTAAEVIAHDLELDLVHVDLSQVVSKYIGETEKQLRRLFDAAEDGSCVLLFDEADALFGSRSQVRDSHDRYANLEVGYLLQRMEQFRGLAILTTNSRDALDQAFTRRLRTIVTFPYPEQALRAAMWRKAFPGTTPTAGLDVDRLAAVDVPGGGIAAIALTAAYLAAAEDGVVDAAAVDTAARWELAKTGRTMPRRPT
ncbi:ATP-binding protein [Cellulomonas sp. ICMP 17802]